MGRGFLPEPSEAGASQARLRDEEAVEPGLLRRAEQLRQTAKGLCVCLLPRRSYQAFEARKGDENENYTGVVSPGYRALTHAAR